MPILNRLRVVLLSLVVAGPSVAGTARTGDAVYNFSCINCHAYGMAGSPKTGDKAAWAPRLVQGTPTLVAHVIEGYKGMPQKGTCTSCSEAELRAAVAYLLAALR